MRGLHCSGAPRDRRDAHRSHLYRPPQDPPPDEPPPEDPPPQADPAEFIVDSNQANNAANTDFYVPMTWTSTASTPGYYGNNYYYASPAMADDGAEFYFYLAAPGTYSVDVWYTAGANRSVAAPIVAFDAAGTEIGYQNVDMTVGGKAWTPAGTYDFTAGWNMVMVSRLTDAGVVIADAVRLTR